MKLISCADFVLTRNPMTTVGSRNLAFIECERYANFLKQPLKLEMFVPCDDEGNVLKEPESRGVNHYEVLGATDLEEEIYNNWLEAKEKVLFEMDDEQTNEAVTSYQNGAIDTYTIEDIIFWWIDIKLTESAIKQIGL